MSWVSERETKKTEDKAYCLLGIFGINMPLLYGELEPAAFKRLQLEILKESDDTSIFAWTCDLTHGSGEIARLTQPEFSLKEESFRTALCTQRTYGLLAWSPHCFRMSGDIRRADLPIADGYRAGIR